MRLVKLLQYLDVQHPDEHWGDYLIGGEPNWSRIVISGHSQGAGMAAYIAKRKAVARVVLFSSPWDYVKSSRQPAPWLSETSATPPERWFQRSIAAKIPPVSLFKRITHYTFRNPTFSYSIRTCRRIINAEKTHFMAAPSDCQPIFPVGRSCLVRHLIPNTLRCADIERMASGSLAPGSGRKRPPVGLAFWCILAALLCYRSADFFAC